MEKQITYSSPYEISGRLPFRQAIPLGMQHVLAMFAGNLAPIIIISTACGIVSGSPEQILIIQSAMFVAGVVTLVQLFPIGRIGGKLPIVMGTSSGFIGVGRSIGAGLGGNVYAYGAILGASIIGGLFEGVLGIFLKPLRKFFPSVVTGCVVMAIGLSLIPVGINSFGGGAGAGDFGSAANLFVGCIVLVVIVALKHFTKGITSLASILFGIITGYVVCAVMGLMLPITYTDAGGAERACSWVLQWGGVEAASLLSLPSLFPVPIEFDLAAIIPIAIMFIVTTVETVGDIAGITVGGMGREPTDKELSGGIICDGLGSTFAAIFGVLPNTSFSQNVGLVAMTKVVNLFAISLGAVFLIACGLFPKLAAVVSAMPQSVLGAAAVMMFASIVVSGIQLITKEKITPRIVTIVSVSLGLGFGMGSSPTILSQLPDAIQLIFGGSGIVPAAIIAIFLNIVCPKDDEDTDPVPH
ncbi:MAG: purine/pyrimidine permease [Spirochaetota bacterium]|nr:purine/pyrimidine permease [Spirochaetota bacterium]